MNAFQNPPAVVDQHGFTVTRSIVINSPVEKVWAAITEPALISRWFGKAEFPNARVGAVGTLSWDDHGAIPIRIEHINPPISITYRWSNDDAMEEIPEELDVEHSTVFTFTLESFEEGTRLTVVESGFELTSDPLANLESHRQGWGFELDELVALLEDAE